MAQVLKSQEFKAAVNRFQIAAVNHENARHRSYEKAKIELAGAHAALIALYEEKLPSVPEGWQLVPKEPTEAMWEAGREPILHYTMKSPPEMITGRSWFDPAKDKPPRYDGHFPKGDAAVWTYRAMLAVAPILPTDAEMQQIDGDRPNGWTDGAAINVAVERGEQYDALDFLDAFRKGDWKSIRDHYPVEAAMLDGLTIHDSNGDVFADLSVSPPVQMTEEGK